MPKLLHEIGNVGVNENDPKNKKCINYLCNGGSDFVLSLVSFGLLGQEQEQMVLEFTTEDLKH